jgi:hypothetical protein
MGGWFIVGREDRSALNGPGRALLSAAWAMRLTIISSETLHKPNLLIPLVFKKVFAQPYPSVWSVNASVACGEGPTGEPVPISRFVRTKALAQ